MAVAIVNSKRGFPLLVDPDGFVYRKDKESARNSGISWRCNLSHKYNCRARAKTENGFIVKLTMTHNHSA